MSEKDLSQSILEKIEAEDVKPKSRWSFLLKDSVVWGVAAVSLLLGSVALSIIIVTLVQNDWDLGRRLHDSNLRFLFVTLPYLWILLLGAFLLVGYYQLRHTKGGYRHKLPMLLGAVVLTSIIAGSLFYHFGVGQDIDHHFAEASPIYRKLANHQLERLVNPEEGVLAGVLLSIESESAQLKTINGENWTIQLPENQDVPPQAINKPVRVTGEKIDETTFKAEEVKPLRPKEGLRERFKKHRLKGGDNDLNHENERRIPGVRSNR